MKNQNLAVEPHLEGKVKTLYQTGPYSRKQETVNGIIHAFGILFGASAMPVLTSLATSHGNTPGIVSSVIYGFSFLLCFSCSTIYHFSVDAAIKRMFMIFDHISIFFLIAGTYTPFLLIYQNNTFGISLLCVLWGLTLVGIFLKAKFTGRYELLSTIIYVLMGCALIVGGRRFFNDLPTDVIVMVCIGGALYLVGVFFYVWDRHVYTHAVWHSFVLAAAICHYVAVLLTM